MSGEVRQKPDVPDLASVEFVMSVLRLWDEHRDDLDRDDLWWTFNSDGSVRFLVNCSDRFSWGTADAEQIEPADLSDMEAAIADLRSSGYPEYGPLLWVSRKRQWRVMPLAIERVIPEGARDVFLSVPETRKGRYIYG